MTSDRFTAVWVSHSSISDWLECPRAYYLKNVYRHPKTGHKIKLISPPLALGQIVHEIIESLSVLPVARRFEKPLIERLDQIWSKISGQRGGFANKAVEAKYKQRAQMMLRRATDHPGPLARKAVKIKMDLPWFWLSEPDNLILCGRIDWLEYLPENDSIHIIDFKTGQTDEPEDSLQLPIYYLLVQNCQRRFVSRASYWYLARSKAPVSQPLPSAKKAKPQILKIAKEIKLARQLERFNCRQPNGCQRCRPFEAIINGQAERVGVDEFKNDIYVLPQAAAKREGVIL